jgi:hypothetical protein
LVAWLVGLDYLVELEQPEQPNEPNKPTQPSSHFGGGFQHMMVDINKSSVYHVQQSSSLRGNLSRFCMALLARTLRPIGIHMCESILMPPPST